MSKKYETKDSGKRQSFNSGMQRDVQDDKPRFEFIVPKDVPYAEQLLTRFASLMARGAVKYGDRNWEQANSEEEMERFRASALRHMMQWFCGEYDEDHAAAILFNIMGYETTKYKVEHEDLCKERTE